MGSWLLDYLVSLELTELVEDIGFVMFSLGSQNCACSPLDVVCWANKSSLDALKEMVNVALSCDP